MNAVTSLPSPACDARNRPQACRAIALLAALIALFWVDATAWAKTRVILGTGGITGLYHLTGEAIATIVNQHKATTGIRLATDPTSGSVCNINAVVLGDFAFGLAQSDRQHQAFNGLAEWTGQGPRQTLRSILSLHPEAITVVAAADAHIASLADLRGRRVSIGRIGSGDRQNAIDALRLAGVDFQQDLQAREWPPAEASSNLQRGDIEAFFHTIGHPNPLTTEATAGPRKVRFLPLTLSDEVLNRHPYYFKLSIPGNLYPDLAEHNETQTIGTLATLITSAAVSDDLVHAVTRLIFENIDELKKQHPALSNLSRKGMLRGLSAPIHPGALRYYRETGLMQ
jgi:uncharacterized protein